MERDLKEVQQKAAGVESSYGRDLLDLAIAARYISELSADGLLLDISMTIIRNWRRSSGPSCPPPWPRLHEDVFPQGGGCGGGRAPDLGERRASQLHCAAAPAKPGHIRLQKAAVPHAQRIMQGTPAVGAWRRICFMRRTD